MTDERLFEVRSPSTGEVLGRFSATPPDALALKLERARRAQARWASLSVGARVEKLAALAPVLLSRIDALAETVSSETGATVTDVHHMEVPTLLETLRVYGERATSLLTPQVRAAKIAPHKRSTLTRVPRGVVGIIGPWNFPLAIPGSEALMALYAGNAVLMKPSELSTLSARALKQCFDDAGIDPELVQLVEGDGDTGRLLIESGVDYVAFTGSSSSGAKVADACARALVPYRLELGGKAAAVVCDDADVERTAAALTWGAFVNAGQVCGAVQRVFVHRAVEEALLDALMHEVGALVLGGPNERETEVAFMCREEGPREVAAFAADALARGASLRAGDIPDGQSRQVMPAVLKGEDAAIRLLHAECFGPLMIVVGVDDDDEAVARANAGPGDLVAYVFSDDKARARGVASRLSAGTVMVNDVLFTYGMPETPWAPVRKSGLGVTHGDEGLLDYTRIHHLCEERIPRVLEREPYWYPYSRARFLAVRAGLSALYGTGMRAKVRGVVDVVKGLSQK